MRNRLPHRSFNRLHRPSFTLIRPATPSYFNWPRLQTLRLRNTPFPRAPFSSRAVPRLSHRPEQIVQASSLWTLSLSALLLCGGLALGAIYIRDPEHQHPSLPAVPLPKNIDVPQIFHIMADQKPTGHIGNLTKEEEEKLQEFWTALFKVCGVVASEGSDTDQQNGGSVTNSDAGTPDAKKPKKRLGLFSRKSDNVNDSPSDSLANSTSSLKISDADDKFGETKEFFDALKDMSPEDLRLTFWGMVKHDHPDALLLRFLRARKYDVNRALVMLVSAFRWRSQMMHLDDNIMVKGDSFMEEESKSEDPAEKQEAVDFSKLLHLGESFIHGTDKSGRPICYIRVRLHRIGAHSEASLERYTVYLIETSRLLLQKPIETAALVFDMTDFSLANMDYTPVKFMIKCFEANYPESLGVILVHKAPWLFSGIWTVIRGWLDPVVASKVHFTKTTEDLEALIPRSNILKELGGDDDYEYKYVEPIGGENERLKETTRRDELLKTRMEIAAEFQNATLSWASSKSTGETDISKTREELADKLRTNYWQLDPYVRAKSMYDRLGALPPSKETRELSAAPQLSEKVNAEAIPAVVQTAEQS